MSRLRSVTPIALLSLLVAAPATAQVVGQEPAVLRGIAAVDAQVSVAWRDAITKDGGPTETQYEQQYVQAFRSYVQQGGLEVSESAPNYLYCSIALLYDESSKIVSAAQSVEYHEPMGENQQWAITWMKAQVYTVPLSSFDPADDARWCAQEFVDEWREGNGGA